MSRGHDGDAGGSAEAQAGAVDAQHTVAPAGEAHAMV
jgi:hypothetical protein